MRKENALLIMVVMLMISLCGCGIKDENHVFNEKKEIASSSEENEIITALSNMHNHYNAYRTCEDEHAIQQLTLTGQVVNTYELIQKDKKITLLGVAYVTEEEIFYLLDKDNQCELWGIPLGHNNNKEYVQTEKKKLLFRTSNIVEILYADAEYIAYKEGLHYKEYDRVHQRNIVINHKRNKDLYSQPDSFVIHNAGSGNRNVNEMILLSKYMGANQYSQNIYVHKVGTGKVKKIANTYTSKNCSIILACSDNKIYYTGLNEDWRSNAQSWDVWCYHCKTHRNYRVIREKQLEDITSFSEIVALYLNQNELWIEMENEKNRYLYCSFTSCGKQSEYEVKKPTQLNQYRYSIYNENKDILTVRIENNQCIIEEICANCSKFHCFNIKGASESWTFEQLFTQ